MMMIKKPAARRAPYIYSSALGKILAHYIKEEEETTAAAAAVATEEEETMDCGGSGRTRRR